MSSRSSNRAKLRQTLELKTYEYVKEYNRLPSSSRLMRHAGCRYIEARKFVLAKIDNGQWKVDVILANQGKVVKSDNVPPPKQKKKQETEEKSSEKTGNLMVDSVVEATKEAIKEEQKKKEDATPSQEAEVGPVTVRDDAFSNIDAKEIEEAEAPQQEEKKDEPVIVTRKAIRKMTKDEQNRFFDAVDTMLKSKDGVPGTSEFFRCASYHGYPRPIYCQHGRETYVVFIFIHTLKI